MLDAVRGGRALFLLFGLEEVKEEERRGEDLMIVSPALTSHINGPFLIVRAAVREPKVIFIINKTSWRLLLCRCLCL